MWTGLIGRWSYVAGTSGTPSLPAGACIIAIWAQGTSGSVTINGGTSIPFTTEFSVRFPHLLVPASSLVFAGTTGYFVEVVKLGHV